MRPNEKGPATAGSVVVRRATVSDLPGILEIYNHAVLNTTATYDYEPRSMEQRRAWYEAHEQCGLPILVAVHPEAGVIGWSSLNNYHDRPGYRHTCENSVYIAANWRGCGLGGRLLAPLVVSARELEKRVILAVIDAQNAVSIRLHERHGFQIAGRLNQVGYKFNRWLDVVIMECLLKPDQELKSR